MKFGNIRFLKQNYWLQKAKKNQVQTRKKSSVSQLDLFFRFEKKT